MTASEAADRGEQLDRADGETVPPGGLSARTLVEQGAVPAGTEPTREPSDLVGSAVAVVLAGIVLAATGFVGSGALVAGVALVQAGLIAAWAFGTGQPGRIGALVLAVAAAGVCDALVVLRPGDQLGNLLPVVGLAVPAMFAHQLARGVVRTRVVESLSDTAVLIAAVAALASLIELYRSFPGVAGGVVSGVVGAAALALATGYLVDLFAPVPRFDPAVRRGLLGVLLGGAVGAAIGFARLHETATVEFTGGRGAFIGGAVGLVAALIGVGISYATAGVVEHAARLRTVVTALVPLGLVMPLAYMLSLAIRG